MGNTMTGRGLPSRLPAGERLLWQGRPAATALGLHAMRIGVVAAYFGLVLAACALVAHHNGAGAHTLAVSLLHRAELAAVPLALIALYAWAVAASTTYSITSRRVVVQSGLALPVSFNIPFARIDAAALRLYRGGAGDLTLRLRKGDKVSFFALWPHVRPWRMAQTEPMLRCVPAAAAVADILAAALAEHARTEALPAAAASAASAAPRPARQPELLDQPAGAMAG